MITVVRRTVLATPKRSALAAWQLIIDLLAATGSVNRAMLLNVSGVAASIIVDRYPQTSPIIVTCDGPRTRIYCVYDEDALDEASAHEDPLGFDPLKGDWHVSLPCASEELEWVSAALKKHGDRVVARDAAEQTPSEKTESALPELVIDPKGLMGQ